MPLGRYSGETIFRGVALGDGPVSKLFPEIWNDPGVVYGLQRAAKRGTEEQSRARQELMDRLRKQDPSFFRRFGLEMQSGDPLQVQAAMNEMGAQIQSLQPASLANTTPPPPPSVDTETLYYYYYYVAAAAAIFIVIAGALALVYPAASTADQLQRDTFVAHVAIKLGPQGRNL